MNIIDLVTARINRVVPKCAVDLKPVPGGLKYLHPRKGWKRVSARRVGVII